MRQAKLGDTARIRYSGALDDGTLFDTSSDRAAIEFTLGGNRVIPGIEPGVTGI